MKKINGKEREQMAEILYTYYNQVYANITNKCNCSCIFCIRNEADAIGNADNLWHKEDPSIEEIKKAMNEFDFTGYDELVFCGYGEPTCAMENLITSAKYAKENHDISIRVNTNGLANLYNKRDVLPELAEVVDCLSISLNAPDAELYQKVTQPALVGAFEGLLDFIREAKRLIPEVKVTIVDVLSDEDTERCFKLADELGVNLRVRGYSD